MAAESLLDKNAFFAKPKTRPTEAFCGWCKKAFLKKSLQRTAGLASIKKKRLFRSASPSINN
jgi:hypothetical protein